MAKKRMYRNGIYGYRYKGYYIAQKNSSTMVYDQQGELFSAFGDEEDAVWAIDMLTATKEDMDAISRLEGLETYELDRIIVECCSSPDPSDEDKRMSAWAKKIRDVKLARLKG